MGQGAHCAPLIRHFATPNFPGSPHLVRLAAAKCSQLFAQGCGSLLPRRGDLADSGTVGVAHQQDREAVHIF